VNSLTRWKECRQPGAGAQPASQGDGWRPREAHAELARRRSRAGLAGA